VFTCRAENGRLDGFALMYQWRNSLYARVVGFDYPRLRAAFEYFNLVFYRPMIHMAECGINRLHLGIEAWEAKVRRGAVVHPLYCCAILATDSSASTGVEWVGPRADLTFAENIRAIAPEAADPAEWSRVDALRS
jgi:hypothetical protein